MKGKRFFKLVAAICLAALIAIPFAAGCAAPAPAPTPAPAPAPAPVPAPAPAPPTPPPAKEVMEWKLQNYKTPAADPLMWKLLGEFCDNVEVSSQGALDIDLYGVNELVAMDECLEATSTDAIQMTTATANQWSGRNTAFELFTTVSFGLSGFDFNIWYAGGDGQKYLDLLYHQYNIQAFPMPRTAYRQFGGHSNFPIYTLDDMVGKRFRMGAGVPQEVLKRVGIDPWWCAGTEVYGALDRGVVDIIKWGGSTSNWGMKFHEVANYAFFPGWQTPGFCPIMQINLDRWNGLPDYSQRIVQAEITQMVWKLAEEAVIDGEYFRKWLDYGVIMTKLDDASVIKLNEVCLEVQSEFGDENPLFKEILGNQLEFLKDYYEWIEWAEVPHLL